MSLFRRIGMRRTRIEQRKREAPGMQGFPLLSFSSSVIPFHPLRYSEPPEPRKKIACAKEWVHLGGCFSYARHRSHSLERLPID